MCVPGSSGSSGSAASFLFQSCVWAWSSQLTNRKPLHVYPNRFPKELRVPLCTPPWTEAYPGVSPMVVTPPGWLRKSGMVKGTAHCKGCLCCSAAAAAKVTFLCRLLPTDPSHCFPSSWHTLLPLPKSSASGTGYCCKWPPHLNSNKCDTHPDIEGT